MEALTIKTFKPDKITAIIVDDKRSGEFNYKSVKFTYDGGEMPLIRIDGNFRLIRFRNKNGDIYQSCQPCRYEKREICMAQKFYRHAVRKFLAP